VLHASSRVEQILTAPWSSIVLCLVNGAAERRGTGTRIRMTDIAALRSQYQSEYRSLYGLQDPEHDPPAQAPIPITDRITSAWRAASTLRQVQALSGVALGGLVAWAATSIAPVATVVTLAIVSTLAGVAALVDLHEHRIPNVLLLIALGVVAIAAGVGGLRTSTDVVIGLFIAAVPLFVVRYGRGLAMGDVKFAAVLGAAGGLLHPFAGLVVVWFAALSSGLYAVVRHRSKLALGPWLWAGYVSACGLGVAVVQVGGQAWPIQP
jgi:leader peptidase (prepilin peptidase) / N-methyltransferase